ncbi:nucleosome assembly protein [Lanmaoa asiatica]|nr:nucleosome assembly protein [Lanmaoa asiatica]
MSSNLPIAHGDITAPTPQNTPLNQAPIAQVLSRPTVPDISEDNEQEEDGEEVLSPGAQSAMLGLVQNRLSDLVGKSSGYIESLPAEVKKCIEALKGVQVKQNQLQNQYKRECLELEKKPPRWRRIDAGIQASLKDDPDYTPLAKDAPDGPTAIPEFWLTALRNHIGISDLITERDAGALKHLIDIRLSYLSNAEPKPGFKISFYFSPNEYFENEVLDKTYLYQEEVGYAGDFVYDRAIGTEIKWKEDKDLTKEFEIKKQRNKNTNRTRLVRKAKPTDSFFNFFSPPAPPSDEEDLEEEDLEELEEKLEMDYQIGEDLKEKVIPRAIDYFTGKALEYDMLEDDDEFDELDEDDDDQFDDDDSDSDNEPPARRRGPPKGRGGSGAGTLNPEECKNQ